MKTTTRKLRTQRPVLTYAVEQGDTVLGTISKPTRTSAWIICAGVGKTAERIGTSTSREMAIAMLAQPRFKPGDTVRIKVACATGYSGQETTVRHVFWEQAGGGQPAGWVCEVDIPWTDTPGMRYRCFWERLLRAA